MKLRRVFAALLCCVSAQLTAAVSSGPPGWPDGQRPALEPRTSEEIFDGVPVVSTVLHGSAMRIRIDSVGGWGRSAHRPPQASFALAHERSPGVTLALSVFAKDEFMPDLSAASWERYIDAIVAAHADRLARVVAGGNIDDEGRLFVFGRPYREIAYDTRVGDGESLHARREVFVLLDTALLVLAVEGEWNEVERLRGAFELFVARLELLP